MVHHPEVAELDRVEDDPSRVELTDVRREHDSLGEREVPEIKSVVTSLGGSPFRAEGSHTGEMRVALKPQGERTRSSEQIANALRVALAKIPGTVIRCRAGQGLFLLRMWAGGTESVAAGDLDGDGVTDLVFVAGGQLRVALGEDW